MYTWFEADKPFIKRRCYVMTHTRRAYDDDDHYGLWVSPAQAWTRTPTKWRSDLPRQKSSQPVRAVWADCGRCRPSRIQQHLVFLFWFSSLEKQRWPELVGTTMSPFWILLDNGGCGDNWSYERCTAPVKSSTPTNPASFFTGRMSFLSSNQQCQNAEGKTVIQIRCNNSST